MSLYNGNFYKQLRITSRYIPECVSILSGRVAVPIEAHVENYRYPNTSHNYKGILISLPTYKQCRVFSVPRMIIDERPL